MKTRIGIRGRRWLVDVGIEAAGLCLILVVLRLVPAEPLRDLKPSSRAYTDEAGRLLRLTLASDDRYRLWVPLERISPALVEATLLYEDRFFRIHPGVNLAALGRAFYQTYLVRGRRVGGSTVTMQLARILMGHPTRGLFDKLSQVLGALWLEARYGKDEILEAYLNLVPYGGNVEGVGASALIYFGKSVADLNRSEAITLAVIPQNPVHRLRDSRARQAARERIVRELLARYPEAAQEETLLQKDVALQAPAGLPFLAPHLTDMLVQTKPNSVNQVRTTLDLGLQQLCERLVADYVADRENHGIRNAAVLLVDTLTMEVKALVGSAAYWNAAIHGQVNGVRAKRSPGSALKPFIYALGIDQGLIHPQSLLRDTPASFGGYSPDNFDGQFAGPLTAEQALVRSRNIPAVRVAAQLSEPNFYHFLRETGVTRLMPEEHYGLSLVLGAVEVSMEELARLYAALASGGRLRSLRYRTDEPEERAIEVLSPEAAFATLDMLRRNPRPDHPDERQGVRPGLPVYWKTGTSYGFRDAWTAGVFAQYALVVWVGNFSGEGDPVLVGGKAAAPLFFGIVDAVKAERADLQDWIRPPPGVRKVEVCAVSGELPGPYCRNRRPTWFIPGRSPIRTCSIHREVLIDPGTGLRSCHAADPGIRKEIYEFWPSDVLAVFRAAGLPRRAPPPFLPGCEEAAEAEPGLSPQIVSPLSGLVYALRTADAKHQIVSLDATADAAARKLYWFADDRFIGASEPGRSLDWEPAPGKFIIRAVDDLGRADSRFVTVVLTQ